MGPLGSGGGGPLLTKTLLFVAQGAGGRGGRGGGAAHLFRAFDKPTGKVVAEIALPGSPSGTPMTYMADGKQYIALATNDGRVVAIVWRSEIGTRRPYGRYALNDRRFRVSSHRVALSASLAVATLAIVCACPLRSPGHTTTTLAGCRLGWRSLRRRFLALDRQPWECCSARDSGGASPFAGIMLAIFSLLFLGG